MQYCQRATACRLPSPLSDLSLSNSKPQDSITREPDVDESLTTNHSPLTRVTVAIVDAKRLSPTADATSVFGWEWDNLGTSCVDHQTSWNPAIRRPPPRMALTPASHNGQHPCDVAWTTE
ncbi:hypothetical protein Vi05172_g11267 [Venturia inaequalis]|nr:hypothetical protein Vi05172_g11267 [Venturia inaequalis]